MFAPQGGQVVGRTSINQPSPSPAVSLFSFSYCSTRAFQIDGIPSQIVTAGLHSVPLHARSCVASRDDNLEPMFPASLRQRPKRPSPSRRDGLQRGFGVFLRFVLFFGLLGGGLLFAPASADAAPLRIRVRGAAKLTARATRDQAPNQPAGINDLVLSGTLTDDAGQPLPLQSVTIRVKREVDPHDPRVAEGMRAAHGCDKSADAPPSAPPRRAPTAWSVRVNNVGDTPEIIVMTDEEGRFCFRARVDPDRYKAVLVYSPAATDKSHALVDGVEREIAFDLTKRGLGLRFDPAPRIIPLDSPKTSIDAVAILDDDANPRVAPGLALTLANEKAELGRTVTDASGRARFVLAGAGLGPPGPGELRISFAGDAETARATHVEEIERHVKVLVKVPAAERGELAPGVPEEGIAIVAEVGSSAGVVAEGSVEARVGEVVVGAAPVERGLARLTLTFTGQGNEALVKLRYVPAAPWYEPLGEPTVRLPIRGPSLLSKAPILVAGLAVLAFFLVGRVSGQKNKPEPVVAEKVEPRDGKPRLEVIRSAERGEEGWRGRIVDAHEGTPVVGARVWIERGTFEGRSVLGSVETGADGSFVLAGVGRSSGDESIAAEARLYSRLVQPLPAPGEIAIALAQRRRAVLGRLVKWARRRGAPFDARPEPTPGHVRRAASGEFGTARWADAVERAVFGPGEIDARVEQEIDRLAPQEQGRPAADELVPPDIGREKARPRDRDDRK
jgi:hypothetical protein